MSNKNLFMADDLGQIGGGTVHDNDVCVVGNDFSKVYTVSGGAVTEHEVGRPIPPPNLEIVWPVSSFATFIGDKDPAEILGFGKWECIEKREIGTDVAYGWKRVE